jgi:AbrB family looped-hinge helix DNA binding protein
MTKMTTKGQGTIPKRLRDRLGLKPGSDVDFELTEDGRVFLKARH